MGEPAVAVETTCAVFPPTLMVLASCCALSSVSSAAKETVNPDCGALAVGGTVLAVSPGAGEEAVLDAVELAASPIPALSPGKVTGWSSPRARGLKPSHAKKYQKSLAPPATVDLTRSFSGSTSVTSLEPSSARFPFGV